MFLIIVRTRQEKNQIQGSAPTVRAFFGSFFNMFIRINRPSCVGIRDPKHDKLTAPCSGDLLGTLRYAAEAEMCEVEVMVQPVQKPSASPPENKRLPLLY